MRSFKVFITDLAKKPPVLLPLVGVAHIIWLLRTVWDSRNLEGLQLQWLQLVWMFGYTFFWLAACDLRRWGIYGYLVLTITNTVLFATIANINIRAHYTSNLFLIDMIFSFFLVLYFKKFQ